MSSELENIAERQAREEQAERVRHTFRSDPKVIELLKASQADEQAERIVDLDDVLRRHPPAD